jgi:hypothetical protein
MCRSTNRRESVAAPEIGFRIVHLAQIGQSGAPVATYREPSVEIALGSTGPSTAVTSAFRPAEWLPTG